MPVRDTSIREISELLAHLGLGRGQTVMIHSALFTLGRIEGGLQGFYEAVRNLKPKMFVIGPRPSINDVTPI